MENTPETELEPTKKDLYKIMQLFEGEPVENDDFEDLTNEIFNVVDNHLKDMEMVAEPNFNFEDTMTSFELMDMKMDLRMQKDKIPVDNKP